MNIIGVVAEYNPFHNGHKYQLDKIKETFKDSLVIICTSSSFTQRGNISVLNKWEKTKIALENGADIVVELPYIYSTQSSDIFAEYALKILNELKINYLVFGSESNNLDDIITNAKIQLFNDNFDKKVKIYMDSGINYPTALNNALKDLNGSTINKPNDLLALSYIKEILKNNYNIKPYNIKRTNDFHDITSNEKIVSASNIRNKIYEGKDYKNQVPNNVYEILKNKQINNKYFEYIKYKIITDNNLNRYLDVDEGLSIRIKNVINKSNTINELIKNIKTKRYTYNKISRMLNHILCSFTVYEKDIINDLEYIRILGFSTKGKEYLNQIKKELKTPILNKYDTKKYKTLEIEKRVTNVYSLIFDDIDEQEIKNKPIITK